MAALSVVNSPYNYVRNNPIALIDPTGMSDQSVGADGLTNEQWILSSSPGANSGLANQFRHDNRTSEINKKWDQLQQLQLLKNSPKNNDEDDGTTGILLPPVYITDFNQLAGAIQKDAEDYWNYLVGHSIASVTPVLTVKWDGGSHIHYTGIVKQKDGGIFYSDRKHWQDGSINALEYGVNLHYFKLGTSAKDGGYSLGINLLGVDMSIGYGDGGFELGSSYTHDGKIEGDDWSFRQSRGNKEFFQNVKNWLNNTFPTILPTFAPGAGTAPYYNVLQN